MTTFKLKVQKKTEPEQDINAYIGEKLMRDWKQNL
jgi:hypothetical protein